MPLSPLIKRGWFYPFGLVVLMWALEAWDVALSLPTRGSWGGIMDRFAIHPRKSYGLPGILISPFLHKGFGHLMGNSLPFLGLSMVILLSGLKRYVHVTAFIILLTGSAVWLLARSEGHLGASGVVFGYIGYLLAKGVVEKSARWIAVSLVVLFFFIGYAHGLLPGQSQISWESHLFGFISGILAAWWMAPEKRAQKFPWDKAVERLKKS